MLSEQGFEALAREQVHHEERVTIVITDVVYGRDTWMVPQSGTEPGLAFPPPDPFGIGD